jgi:hypothetical protein
MITSMAKTDQWGQEPLIVSQRDFKELLRRKCFDRSSLKTYWLGTMLQSCMKTFRQNNAM